MVGKRRLTLAPVVRRALLPAVVALEPDSDDDKADDWQRDKGREAMSREVAMAMDATLRPKPVHGVQGGGDPSSPAQVIASRFWAQPEDTDDEDPVHEVSVPSTPEFVKDALEADFTVDQLARAERALASGNIPSSSDCRLSRSVISSLVHRKLVGTPWHGPLPSPRVSPPRTLGDFFAKATYQYRSKKTPASSGSVSGRSPSTSRQARTPARSGSAGADPVSKKFENSNPWNLDPIFPPLNPAELPVVVTSACVTGERHELRESPNLISIGPGKFFRPTPGLCSLFARTAARKPLRQPPKHTASSPFAEAKRSPKPPTKKTFADVVREGKPMAAQEGFGGRGGGRFNPGFDPGFNPGYGGRGGGRGRFPPRGRGRGHGGHGGHGHHGGHGYGGFNGGYQGAGRGGGWHYNNDGRGWGYGGQNHQPVPSGPNHGVPPPMPPPNHHSQPQAGSQTTTTGHGQAHPRS